MKKKQKEKNLIQNICKMKVAIYIRTSTTDQNPENQLKECLMLCSTKTDKPIIYKDKQSAWKEEKERPDFERLKKDIRKGLYTDLIVWDFDRIYRIRRKFKEFLEFTKAYNIKLHSVRQGWIEELHKIPQPWNEIVYDLMINIYGHIAEDESNKKSDRVKLAVRKKEKGTYSYKGNKWGRKQLSTFKQNQINKLRKERITIREIATELNISKSVVHKYLSQTNKENQGHVGHS